MLDARRRVRVLDARSSSRRRARADVRFVVKPSFTWVGNTTVNGDAWTTVTRHVHAPAGSDPSTLQVYIGSVPHSGGAGPYTYLVDDLVVTTAAEPPPTPPAGVVLDTDFEAGLDGWVPRGDAQGNPTVDVTAAEAHGGTQAALVSDRTSQGDGIGHDVTGIMLPGVTYEITAWVQFAAGAGDGDDLAEPAARQRRRIVVRHPRHSSPASPTARGRRSSATYRDGERGHGLPVLRDAVSPTGRPRASSSTTSS